MYRPHVDAGRGDVRREISGRPAIPFDCDHAGRSADRRGDRKQPSARVQIDDGAPLGHLRDDVRSQIPQQKSIALEEGENVTPERDRRMPVERQLVADVRTRRESFDRLKPRDRVGGLRLRRLDVSDTPRRIRVF